ncbi:hypothetical protein CRG98_008278 [Punica granatum]|uniref:Uncharacterized protein n=1 Tax=Punica granatum TaxID=22663 RepID=A0A2I0KS14_PUNGR|nr:hypothetical protein CRG98_008278 [Punica granatum]
MGRYLGVPPVQGRIERDYFIQVPERVEVRLRGWSSSALSMAWRVILARSVIQSIPTYSMQSMRFPISMCDDIERMCRNFIWGHSAENHKIHLVKWNIIRQPLEGFVLEDPWVVDCEPLESRVVIPIPEELMGEAGDGFLIAERVVELAKLWIYSRSHFSSMCGCDATPRSKG